MAGRHIQRREIPARRAGRREGFTLIEMSIVLVIIGLLVGGVLTGRDLIRAAEVRAQISQIERFNTAVNTFREKYGAMPGDIGAAYAATFGFDARGTKIGEGDGDGILKGTYDDNDGAFNQEAGGENAMFWKDLSQAALIAGSFTMATPTGTGTGGIIAPEALASFFPRAAIGRGNFVVVFSGADLNDGNWSSTGVNYYGLQAIDSVGSGYPGSLDSHPGLTVQQAYAIDSKTDDGLPQSGRVTAQYPNGPGSTAIQWAGSGGAQGLTRFTTATSGTSATCFDNGNTDGVEQRYSVQQSGGAGMNCALSLELQ